MQPPKPFRLHPKYGLSRYASICKVILVCLDRADYQDVS